MLKNTSQLKMISLLLLGALSSFAVNAHGDEAHPNKSTLFVGIDSEPAHTVTAFKKALKQGDQVTARKLLADNVIIFEGGGIATLVKPYFGLKKIKLNQGHFYTRRNCSLMFCVSLSCTSPEWVNFNLRFFDFFVKI